MSAATHFLIFALATLMCASCSGGTTKQVTEAGPLAQPVAGNSLRSDNANGSSPAKVFLPILQDAKMQTQLTVLLPSELPSSYDGLAAELTAEANKYDIGLFSKLGVGDSGYVAGFLAEKEEKFTAADIGNTKQVKLAKNTAGFFRPVSCGGSCAPINLWWEQAGVLYTVQARMPPDTPEDEQERFIVPIANSAILGGPR